MSDEELISAIRASVNHQPTNSDKIFFSSILRELNFRYGKVNDELIEFQIRALDAKGLLKAAYDRDGVFCGVHFW